MAIGARKRRRTAAASAPPPPPIALTCDGRDVTSFSEGAPLGTGGFARVFSCAVGCGDGESVELACKEVSVRAARLKHAAVPRRLEVGSVLAIRCDDGDENSVSKLLAAHQRADEDESAPAYWLGKVVRSTTQSSVEIQWLEPQPRPEQGGPAAALPAVLGDVDRTERASILAVVRGDAPKGGIEVTAADHEMVVAADKEVERARSSIADASCELELMAQLSGMSRFVVGSCGGGRGEADTSFAHFQSDTVMILMPKLDTDLKRVTDERGPLCERQAQFYGASVILGLEDLHEAGIFHLDVKPENCLLNTSGALLVTDFGLSKREPNADHPDDEMELDVAGTPEYWPPEFARADLSGEDTISGSGRAVDLWGLGALLFVGLTGRSPIVDKPDRTTSAAARTGPNRALSEEDDAFSRAIVEYADGARQLWTPADCGTISPEARRLVERLLEPNPEDRLGCRSSGGFDALKSDAFFRDFAWQDLRDGRLQPPEATQDEAALESPEEDDEAAEPAPPGPVTELVTAVCSFFSGGADRLVRQKTTRDQAPAGPRIEE